MRYSCYIAVIAGLFVAACLAGSAQADERRVALVIGNSNYQHTAALRNPANDAADVATGLRTLGFEVVEGTDLTIAAMDEKRSDFLLRAVGADVAVFYYAGHGLQYNSRNFILPTDARLANEFALRRETTSIDEMITDMQKLAKLNIVFLDACRNNPLADKMMRSARGETSGGRGLAKMEIDRNANTLIVFATAPGDVAEDGLGRNSPFTEALLRHIEKPLDIEVMLKQVGKDVSDQTQGRQQPERLSKLKSTFQFPKSPGEPILKPPVSTSRAEVETWTHIKDSKDPEIIKGYIDKFPAGVFANQARKKLQQLSEAAKVPTQPKAAAPDPELECSQVLAEGVIDAQRRFLDAYPTHRCSDQIRKIIRMKSDAIMWTRILRGSTISDFKEYLEAFPDGVYAGTAKDKIAMIGSLEAIERNKNAPQSVTRNLEPAAPPPTPSYQTPPQPQVAAVIAPRPIYIRQYSNRWVDGRGYKLVMGGTYAQCEERCMEDPNCRMMEYYFGSEEGGKKCNLFEHTTMEKSKSDQAHVGIKQ